MNTNTGQKHRMAIQYKMKKKSNILLYLLVAFGCFTSSIKAQQAPALTTAQLQDIVIMGETNINKFQLFLDSKTNNEVKDIVGIYENSTIIFTIPIERLNCKNQIILYDFHNLVNADQHPSVTIKIDIEQFYRHINERKESEPTVLEVSLSGQTRKIKTNNSSIKHMSGSKTLTGNANIYLSDFLLEPPKKFMGLVRLNNKVNINFKILITET